MGQEIIRIDLEGVNCYLGKSGDSYILFDTGGHMTMDRQFTNRREALERELEKAGCGPENLKLVVLTHGDNDHAANAAYIREKYRAGIAMHPGDRELVESPDMEILMKSFNYRSSDLKNMFLSMKEVIEKVTLKILGDFESFTPDILIDEGFNLSEYGFDATVLHLPGHTAGSIGILTAGGDLIAGDTLANVEKPDISLNALDFEELSSSAGRLKSLAVKTIYPGHGNPFEASFLQERL